MEKYANLKEIVSKYLNGKLSRLRMEYDNPNTTEVIIIYEDDNQYSFEYVISIENESKDITFIRHFCGYCNDHIQLRRSKPFEASVSMYLYGEKK